VRTLPLKLEKYFPPLPLDFSVFPHPKNVNIKIQTTNIYLLISVCETLTFTLRREGLLRIECKGEYLDLRRKKLHNERVMLNLYLVLSVFRPKRLRRVRHVGPTGQMRKA
jgi:hypothetical protein